jgi:hypothetical protein
MSAKIASAVPLVLLSLLVWAQDRPTRAVTPELVEIWLRHAVRVDGSTNPMAIPYGVAMERAFWQFADESALGDQRFRQQVRNRFSATDAEIQSIAEIASLSFSFSAEVRGEASQRYDLLCTEIVNADLDTLNALTVAEQLTAIANDQAARLDAHYTEAVASLSASSRTALETYVDTEIRPRMKWGQDLVGLAIEVPQAFLSLRQVSCERRLERPVDERAWRVEEQMISPQAR